ncbi:MAG: response regulator [Planctomycetes bacterium]|nr:response regulator [Planctomycetota bacterium]
MSDVPKVMIIDDNRGDLLLITETLAECHDAVEVEAVQNAVQAYEYFRELKRRDAATRPRLILLDLNMPIYRGTEVLYYLKHDADFKAIPIIVFTSSAAPNDRMECEMLGVDEYIPKPMELAGFKQIIHEMKRKYLGCCHETDCSLA